MHMSGSQFKSKYALRLYILAAVCNCVILLFVLPLLAGKIASSYNQGKFTDGYDQIADNLVHGRGYRFYPDTAPTLMREPGYPLVLAGIGAVFGDSFLAVKCFNLISVLLASWILRSLAAQLFDAEEDTAAALPDIAAALFLIHPGVLVAESRGGVESFFTLLITAFALLLTRGWKDPKLVTFMLAGVVLGMTVMVRSTPIIYPAILLLLLLAAGRQRRNLRIVTLRFAVFVVPMVLVIAPWAIRNFRLTNRVIPTASVLGVSAQAGQYINERLWTGKPFWILDREASRERDKVAAQLGYAFEDGANGYYQTFYRTQDELNFSAYLMQQVKESYIRHPALLVRSMLQNLANFWFGGRTWMATAANLVVQLPYLMAAWVGLQILRRRGKLWNALPVLGLMLGVVAVHLPILAQARYSIPFVPLLACFAAGAIIAAISPKTQSKRNLYPVSAFSSGSGSTS